MTKARDLASGGFGLVLVKPSSVVGGTDNGKGTVSFSGVSSVSLNGVFSSTYDNYRIIIQGTGSSDGELDMRYRLLGTDNSTANSYFTQLFEGINTTPYAVRQNTTSQRIGSIRNSAPSGVTVEVFNPFKVEQTTYHSFGVWFSSTDYVAAYRTGRHNQTVSYDGFTIFQGSNITGTVSVYGYNK